VYKNVSCQAYSLGNNTLNQWLIVYEAVPGLKEKLQAMVDKMKNNLARLYKFTIQIPNLVEVRDMLNWDWNIGGNQLVVFALNSRARKDVLTRKYEMIK